MGSGGLTDEYARITYMLEKAGGLVPRFQSVVERDSWVKEFLRLEKIGEETNILDTLQEEWDTEEVASVPMNVLFSLLMFIARRMVK